MATKGADILITIGTDVIGGQRGATIKRGSDLIDASCKNSRWRKVLAGRGSISFSCDALYLASDSAYAALLAAYEAGTTVSVTATGLGTGGAIVTDLSVNAPDNDVATVSCTLEVDGEL